MTQQKRFENKNKNVNKLQYYMLKLNLAKKPPSPPPPPPPPKKKKKKKEIGGRTITIFRAEIAAKYGAPVYSRHPPITAIFPERKRKLIKD
jgi:hypothetical protein